MTQAKVKDIVEKLGLKAEEISDEMLVARECHINRVNGFI